MAHQFGMGTLYAIPSGATPTPVPIAVLKDCTVDFKVSKKYLSGQYKVPIDAGEGAVEISVKVKNADFRAASLGLLLAGLTPTVGSQIAVMGEAATVPGVSTYTVTVSKAANFIEDGGVLNLSTGLWMARGAAAAAGVYSVAAGVYTFDATAASQNLSIVYTYSSSTIGSTSAFSNAVMGASQGYAVRVYNVYNVNGVLKPLGFKFPNVHFDNLSVGFKAEDFAEQDLSGRAIQDTASLNVFTAYTGE